MEVTDFVIILLAISAFIVTALMFLTLAGCVILLSLINDKNK